MSFGKQRALAKLAAAHAAGEVDSAIEPVLVAFNAHPDLYTTSSCAGRLQLIALPEIGRKDAVAARVRWHDLPSFKVVAQALAELALPAGYLVLLQAQSPILHVACRNETLATQVRARAHAAGWKYSSLFAHRRSRQGERWMVEILSSNRLDCPLGRAAQMPFPGPERLAFIIVEANAVLRRAQARLPALVEIPKQLGDKG